MEEAFLINQQKQKKENMITLKRLQMVEKILRERLPTRLPLFQRSL